jgi:hypothetical protein
VRQFDSRCEDREGGSLEDLHEGLAVRMQERRRTCGVFYNRVKRLAWSARITVAVDGRKICMACNVKVRVRHYVARDVWISAVLFS